MIRRRPRTEPDEGRSVSLPALSRRLHDEARENAWVLPEVLARDDAVPSWTRIGVIDDPGRAVVDSRGLVSPWGARGPSLDWVVGAEDRWHIPAREGRVEQHRLDAAPVVETTMRVPGGEVAHRAFGALATGGSRAGAWLVVEVENRSAVPVALAWVVRPYSPAGFSGLAAVEVRPTDSDGGAATPHLIDVTGIGHGASGPFGVMVRAPSRWARCHDGRDPVHVLLAGDAEPWPMPAAEVTEAVEGSEHPGAPPMDGGLCSAVLVVPVPHTATARVLLTAHPDLASPTWPGEIPDADSVARGWSTLAGRGPRVDLPDPVLADAVAAARRALPLAVRGPDEAAPDRPGARMEIAAALAHWGAHHLVGPLLHEWPAAQQPGGGFGSLPATASALRALATHAVASGDVELARVWLPELSGAIEILGRPRRRRDATAESWLDFVARVAGLEAGATLLAGLAQPDASRRVSATATEIRAALVGRVATEATGSRSTLVPHETAATALAETDIGHPAASLWALLRGASPTWTWPDPERWIGDDGLVQARLLTASAQLLLADRSEGVALVPWMPPDWWGQGWEVHDLPTRWGPVSYAVRWHGTRPAVLWEIGEPRIAVAGTFRITAPGLDRSWHSGDGSGEALLTEVPMPTDLRNDGDARPEGAGARGVAVAAPPRSVWRVQDPGPDAARGSSTPQDPGPPHRDDDAGSFS